MWGRQEKLAITSEKLRGYEINVREIPALQNFAL